MAPDPALAQDPTSTMTRRATPTSTPTRTRTLTPTPPTVGENTFLCSAGLSDGAVCETDEDCPDGACVLTQGVCDGGARDAEFCEASSECEGGACRAAQRVCLGGDARGNSCLRDEHCPESQCVSTGLFCDDGDFVNFSCIDDGGCTGPVESGNCRGPDVLICTAGANDGAECVSHLSCPAGACVIAQKSCVGGGPNGELRDCESDFDCPNGPCEPTQRVCNAGDNKDLGCFSNPDCPGGACVSTGRYCDGGVFDLIACIDAAGCSPEGEEPAPCATPTQDLYCSGGSEDAAFCDDDGDCPGGACVFSQGVCDGGDNDGFFCASGDDCDGSLCVQSQKVCLAGDFEGFGCLVNSHCGSGVLCAPSGLYCIGGDFEGLSCVSDVNCCDDGPDADELPDCEDTDENDGVCIAPSVVLCSAGPNDNQECDSHFDCPSGSCVIAQGVCEGGSEDGNECQGDVNCSGGTCVETSHICTSGDAEGFGCLSDDDCFEAGAGSCQATGQFCDGGDTSATDYDPFAVDFSCTDDNTCSDTFACSTPLQPGFVCSAGDRDGQSCSTNDDCAGTVCVLEDALCDGGGRDNELCDSGADCDGGGCDATHLVCSVSGFSCVNGGQCESGEECIASGKQCLFTSFGSLSCVDDGNCYEGDPNAEVGACGPLDTRGCSVEAPCSLQYAATGEVYGSSVDPTVSPATFDFYLTPIPANGVGAVVVLRPGGGDADLYLGPNVSPLITSPEAYPLASNHIEGTDDSLRLSPLSEPTFAAFTEGLDEFAVAIAGVGTFDPDNNPGPTTYRVDAVFLAPSDAGDANCSGDADATDIEGLLSLTFDAATRLTDEGSAIGRCLGADGNGDDRENAADLTAAIRAVAQP